MFVGDCMCIENKLFLKDYVFMAISMHLTVSIAILFMGHTAPWKRAKLVTKQHQGSIDVKIYA